MSFYIKSYFFKGIKYKQKSNLSNVFSFPQLYKKAKIIKKNDMPDFSNINYFNNDALIKNSNITKDLDKKDANTNCTYPLNIKFTNLYSKVRYKEIDTVFKDFINFKKMSGNEIIYNLQNIEYFSKIELLNAFYQFAIRISLPENKEFYNGEEINEFNKITSNKVIQESNLNNISDLIYKDYDLIENGENIPFLNNNNNNNNNIDNKSNQINNIEKKFVNNLFTKIKWEEHETVGLLFKKIEKLIIITSVEQSILIAKALDLYNSNDKNFWSLLETNFDRLLHKIKLNHFPIILRLFNKKLNKNLINDTDNLNCRGSKDFFYKIFTIIPVHIENFEAKKLIDILEIMYNQNIKNLRLITYFIVPKFEKCISNLEFNVYVRLIHVLARFNYTDDNLLWKEILLPKLLEYSYNYEDAKLIYELIVFLEVECPSIDASKYVIILKKLLQTFDNIIDNEESEVFSNIRVKVNKDAEIVIFNINNYVTKKSSKSDINYEEQKMLEYYKKNKNQTLKLRKLNDINTENLSETELFGNKSGPQMLNRKIKSKKDLTLFNEEINKIETKKALEDLESKKQKESIKKMKSTEQKSKKSKTEGEKKQISAKNSEDTSSNLNIDTTQNHSDNKTNNKI